MRLRGAGHENGKHWNNEKEAFRKSRRIPRTINQRHPIENRGDDNVLPPLEYMRGLDYRVAYRKVGPALDMQHKWYMRPPETAFAPLPETLRDLDWKTAGNITHWDLRLDQNLPKSERKNLLSEDTYPQPERASYLPFLTGYETLKA